MGKIFIIIRQINFVKLIYYFAFIAFLYNTNKPLNAAIFTNHIKDTTFTFSKIKIGNDSCDVEVREVKSLSIEGRLKLSYKDKIILVKNIDLKEIFMARYPERIKECLTVTGYQNYLLIDTKYDFIRANSLYFKSKIISKTTNETILLQYRIVYTKNAKDYGMIYFHKCSNLK